MKKRDLERIDGYIERYNALPKTADLKIKVLLGEPTELEKKQAKEIIDEIDEIFAELWAFIKVKFGEDSSYLKRCHDIDFDAAVSGIRLITNNKAVIQSSWQRGMHDFGHLLRDLKLEISMILEEQDGKSKSVDSEITNLGRNTTHISNSNVVMGNISDSEVSTNIDSGNSSAENVDPPSKKWQIIGVIIAIIIGIISYALKNYNIN